MIPVFIGHDSKEVLAWHVLASSIIHRTRSPVALTPLGNKTLDDVTWKRPRGPYDSTEFSTARFLVPYLQDYRGWAIFMDSDCVCGEDIERLWEQRDNAYAVMCVKHQHTPKEHHKFLGQPQTIYGRKNWSSLMLFNCGHPATRNLTLDYVTYAPGIDLHSMNWAEGAIGSLKGSWNVLSTSRLGLEHPTHKEEDPIALLHYTRGGPWHGEFTAGQNAWLDELTQMLGGENPCASVKVHVEHGEEALAVAARYARGTHEAKAEV